MPKILQYVIILLVFLAMIPPALILRARYARSEMPRIHFVQDMDNQHKYRAQHGNELFADGRAMRRPVEGTVARGELGDDLEFARGYRMAGAEPQWLDTYPAGVTLDMDLLDRGQFMFNIYCQPCHGLAGYGDGMINQRVNELMTTPATNNGTTWVAPKSIHEDAIVAQPVGQIFNSITNGVRNMAGYESQVSTADRWAIVAYVKALQRSQNIDRSEIPPEMSTRVRIVDFPLPPVVEE